MKLPLFILGFIWQLPAIIVTWLFYILPLILTGSIKFYKWYDYMPVFKLVNNDSWYAKKWKDWAGWSGPWIILIKDLPGPEDDLWILVTIIHEHRHCVQQMIFGIFFYPAYILDLVVIWVFFKDKHAYIDNHFERDARKAAGQKVNIPKEEWMHGEDDRWPWW